MLADVADSGSLEGSTAVRADRKAGVSLRRSITSWVLVAPALLLVLALCILPLGLMVELSLRTGYSGDYAYTLDQYGAIWTSRYAQRQVATTFGLAFTVTAICAIAGYPVGYYLARASSRWRNYLFLALTLPLLVNVVVRTIGWTILLGNEGFVNWLLLSIHLTGEPLTMLTSFWSVVVGMVHVLIPFMVISIVGVIQKIDPALEAVARAHGATRVQTFLHVVLPISAPGLVTGSVLVFCLTIGAYVTPIWLGRGKVLTLARGIYEQTIVLVDLPAAAATAVSLVSICAVVIVVFSVLTRRFGPRRR